MTVDRCIRFHRGVFSVRICRRVKTVKDARVLVNWIRENFTDGNNCEFYEDTKRNEQIVQTFKAFRTYREAKKLHLVKYRFTRQIFGENWQRSKAAREFYCYEWESGRGGKLRKAV